MRVVSNLFHKETTLFEWPMEKMKTLSVENQGIFLPEQYEEAERQDQSADLLRNLYLHKRKVWSNPVIKCLNTYSLYATLCGFSRRQQGEAEVSNNRDGFRAQGGFAPP